MAARRGVARIGHIATPTLRVQKLTQDSKVRITKKLGASNPADLGTTHLDENSIRKVLEKCHGYIRKGRSRIALLAEVEEVTRQHP